MALPLHQVGAVREIHDQRGHRQQRDGARVGRDDDRAGQPERGVGGGHHEVHREHLADRAEAQGAFGDRDRQPDQPHGQHGTECRPDEYRDPGVRVEGRAIGRDHVHDHRGERGGEGELREVEDQLHRREPALDHERRRRAHHRAQHQVSTGGEQQAEHEWQVAQRERVSIAAELEVDHAPLGHQEAGRQSPPGQVGLEQGGQVVHVGDVQDGRRRRDREVQPPDRAEARNPGPETPRGRRGRFLVQRSRRLGRRCPAAGCGSYRHRLSVKSALQCRHLTGGRQPVVRSHLASSAGPSLLERPSSPRPTRKRRLHGQRDQVPR